VAARLVEALSGFAAEIEALLRKSGESTIADGVGDLEIVAPCRCENVACGSFWTRDPVGQKVPWRNRTVPLDVSRGSVVLDLDVDPAFGHERIAHFEILDREDVKKAIHRLFGST